MPLVLDILAPHLHPVQTIEDRMSKRMNILKFTLLALTFKVFLLISWPEVAVRCRTSCRVEHGLWRQADLGQILPIASR